MTQHLRTLAAAAGRMTGVRTAAMWPSVLDVRTGDFPVEAHVPARVYRLIGAPRGSTLYWDQPLVQAAYPLAEITGARDLADAADRYVQAFLERCVAPNGLFQWGNHQYFDLFEDRVVTFHKGYHELRPITPDWDLFWRHAPEQTAAYIRTMGRLHVYDPATGGFNRHDDGRKDHAFLEAGAILVESLAWLSARTDDADALALALRIARYSFNHRDPRTGLVRNEPDHGRWDSLVCTTEVGLWAQCLLRAADVSRCEELADMARQAVAAYLDHGFDDDTGRYWGQVAVADGAPVISEQPGYWPRRHADPWNTDQWPTHDYPMALADACVTLARLTGDPRFGEAVDRWAHIAMATRPALSGGWSYAWNYGQCLQFLNAAQRPADAARLAQEAVTALWSDGLGLFRGYDRAPVYEAVDGVGDLFLALLPQPKP